jgi:hypothetical protein
MHLMLDEMLVSGVKHWITEAPLQRRVDADHAIQKSSRASSTSVEDRYLRARRIRWSGWSSAFAMRGAASPRTHGGGWLAPPAPGPAGRHGGRAMVLMPASNLAGRHDAVQAKLLFAGFATDVGGETSHTVVAQQRTSQTVVGARSSVS